ncbi:MAG TPA: AMP-binding protein, partial [Blastocatellia bacterium]|nr:AMP-binding protein [Blastocatellia bacterium]
MDSQRFNLAEAICRRHADRVTRVALLDAKPLAANCYTFGGLDFLSDKFASALNEQGVNQSDAVAVVLAPSAALAVALLGTLKCGAVAVPLSPSLDLGEIEGAVNDSRAKALIAPFEQREAYAAIFPRGSVSTVFLAGDS